VLFLKERYILHIMNNKLLALGAVVVVCGVAFVVNSKLGSQATGAPLGFQPFPSSRDSRSGNKSDLEKRFGDSDNIIAPPRVVNEDLLVQISDSYATELSAIEVSSYESDLSDFSLTLNRIRLFPEPYRSNLIDALFSKRIGEEIVKLDFDEPETSKSFFNRCDYFSTIVERIIPDGGKLKQLFIDRVLASLNDAPGYAGIDSFIEVVNSNSFEGREDFYVGAYVVKITGENSRPDLKEIPISDDPFLNRKLHQSLFDAYAVADRTSAVEFFLADEFAGDVDSESVTVIVGAMSVHQWDVFTEILAKSQGSGKTAALVRMALERKEIREDEVKAEYLKSLGK